MANDKFLFVVSGAAGTGKDSVVKALREAHPEIEKTVSATTRTPRPGEQEGVDYYYRTREQFQQLLQLLLGHGGPGQCPLPLRQHCRHREPHPQPQLLDLAPPVLRQGHHPAPQAQGQDPRRLLHAGFSLRHQPVHLRLTHPMRTGPRLCLLFV